MYGINFDARVCNIRMNKRLSSIEAGQVGWQTSNIKLGQ
jgi:hypothetical protein